MSFDFVLMNFQFRLKNAEKDEILVSSAAASSEGSLDDSSQF